MAGVRGMIDPAIFEQLQSNIDDDSQLREEVRNILQKRERQGMCISLGDMKSLKIGRPNDSIYPISRTLSARS